MNDLKDYYFFSSLNDKELKKLKEISFSKKFSKGDILFYKDEKSKYLHLLSKGVVKVYKHDFKDNEIVIHHINAISFIAEIANYEEIPFPANCSFETQGEVIFIDYEKFKEEFLYKKEIAMLFIKSLSQKIIYLEKFINSSVSVDVAAKVAKFIYDNEKSLDSIKQLKIAEILNIREETLSRKISALVKKGIIKKRSEISKS
ncbi:Crp/Fnr family transcriptional regulator [Halarcobacter anaerophilus]|uniref:Crp/Fnr family transcriptional regulator n=1 Tax=Halarcobacter anaerophilus TaxID=877500 RepID=UPI000A9D2D10|nr:Crp/Fnr family transcriptional regulator [Halarcobacter anaerophilus]